LNLAESINSDYRLTDKKCYWIFSLFGKN